MASHPGIVFTGQALVRVSVRVADRLLPGPLARWAGRLWCAVPPRPPGGSPGRPVPGGSDFDVLAQGAAVRGTVWGAGPVVYLVHGWGGVGDQLSGFVLPLLTRGFRVVVFDAPSHGRSDPGPSGPGRGHGVDFVEALHVVAARFGPAHAVVAHSLGALTALLGLRFGWLTTSRLVFLAPLPNVRDAVEQFAGQLGLGPRSRLRLKEILDGDRGMGIEAFDLSLLAPYAAHARLLLVHDRGDRRTPSTTSAAIARTWPGARLVLTEGLGHTRLLADAGVIDTVATFIAEESPSPVPQLTNDLPVAT